MNAILKEIISARNGLYCHALEVDSVYELENAIAAIADEFKVGYPNQLASIEDLKDFFNTIEIYCNDEENEDEIYSFSTDNFINEMIL